MASRLYTEFTKEAKALGYTMKDVKVCRERDGEIIRGKKKGITVQKIRFPEKRKSRTQKEKEMYKEKRD